MGRPQRWPGFPDKSENPLSLLLVTSDLLSVKVRGRRTAKRAARRVDVETETIMVRRKSESTEVKRS